MIRCWVLGLFSVALLLAWPAMAAQDKITLSAYAKSPVGSVLFLRHALAPGTGDPADFTLADCSSQRNLDAVGRWQAATLGELFRRELFLFECCVHGLPTVWVIHGVSSHNYLGRREIEMRIEKHEMRFKRSHVRIDNNEQQSTTTNRQNDHEIYMEIQTVTTSYNMNVT